MHTADWTVLIAYLAGTVVMGVLLGRLVKNSSDLFSAGGESPWWASGLSAFMTMFSANTFVVWVVSPEGLLENVGELILQGSDGGQGVSTSLASFGM